VDFSRQVTKLKQAEVPWLKEASSYVLTQSIRDLEKAFKAFYAKRASHPRFKKRRGEQAVRYQLDTRLKNSYVAGSLLVLPGLGPLRLVWSRVPPGRPKMVTLKRDGVGRYFVFMAMDRETLPLPRADRVVGLDAGLSAAVTFDDGTKVAPPRYLERRLKQLKRRSRALSRAKKGSRGRARARWRLARGHARVRDCRREWLHQLSSKVIHDNQDGMKRLAAFGRGGIVAPHATTRSRRNYRRRPAVDHCGIDIGMRESQVAIQTEAGEIIEGRVRTDRQHLQEFFRPYAPMRILVEAGTESEWVARCLEEMGHEVIVADPNYAPMYAQRSRRVKTDRRDAQALAVACRIGAFRPVHRTSDERRHVRALLAARDGLVRSRAKMAVLIRSLIRREGIRVPGGNPKTLQDKMAKVVVPSDIQGEIAPLLAMIEPLTVQIATLEKEITTFTQNDQGARLLMSCPQVGPITAAAFVASIDTPSRFRDAHQVEAYLGLVPREWSSSEIQRRGPITKAGNSRVRWLLAEVACGVMRHANPDTLALRSWATRIAQRRGKRTAQVALARRLAGILWAMWRDNASYNPASLVKTQRIQKVA
jgi:transposase